MQDRKNHFEVRNGRKTKAAQDCQLQQLKQREEVHFTLWNRANVVVGRVGCLGGEGGTWLEEEKHVWVQ